LPGPRLADAQDLDCLDSCSFLAPSNCYEDQVNGSGGCCGGSDDARRVNKAGAGCASSWPSGSSFDWLCDKCHTDSACHGLKRVGQDDAVCQQNSCKDGCWKDGFCNHTITEASCVADVKSVWCLPCSKDLWDICYVGSYCYANCNEGCCSSQCGTCPSGPSLPFEMRRWGQDCASCAMIPTMCDECFPRSMCSANYNALHGVPNTGTTECATASPTAAPAVATAAPTSPTTMSPKDSASACDQSAMSKCALDHSSSASETGSRDAVCAAMDTYRTCISSAASSCDASISLIYTQAMTAAKDSLCATSAVTCPVCGVDGSGGAGYEGDDKDFSGAWPGARMGFSLLAIIVGLKC